MGLGLRSGCDTKDLHQKRRHTPQGRGKSTPPPDRADRARPIHVMSVAGSRQAAASAGANKRKRTEDGMAAVDSFTRSILMKDLVAMQKNPLPFAWMPDDVLIDDNILTWQLWLIGPDGTQLCDTPAPPRALSQSVRARLCLGLCEREFQRRHGHGRAGGPAARAALPRRVRAQPRVRCFLFLQRGRGVQDPADLPAVVPERAAGDALRNAAVAPEQ